MFSKYLHRSTASTNPDGLNVWSLPTLHRAAYKNKIDKLIRLLNKRQNGIDKKDNVGRTALHYGCLAGSVQVVQLILDRNGKIIADNVGQSPVFMAIGNGHLEIVKIFYGIKFDFNKADNNGTTPLHLAIFKKNVTIVEFLVKQVNVNVDASDMQLTTPLHQAIRSDIPMVVLLLVEKGAKTEIRDKIGKTPLMMACVKGQEQCVEILLKNKANIYRKGNSSVVEQIATQFGHHRIYTMVKKFRLASDRKVRQKSTEVQIESHSEAQKNSKGSGSIPDKPLDSGLGMLSSSGQMTRSNQLCNAASIEAPEFVKMQFSADTPSSVKIETAISEHQQNDHHVEVAVAIDIKPYVEDRAATAEFESPSPDQPLAQFDKDTPELGSNDIAVTFDEVPTESPSSVESETAVSQHQQEILSAEVTSSLANDITPDADEPTATAEFEFQSSVQPLAQFDKETPEIGSNDIAVTFDEDPTESPSSVESVTAVSQHQQEILSAEVTSSLANDITPDADEPTATAEFESPSPDQPLAQFDKDTPELGSNDIAVTFDEDPTESPSSVESETAVSQNQQEILSAEVASSLANDITPDADEPTATAEFESPSPDQPLAQFDKDTPELGSNDIAVTFDEDPTESPSSVESETAVSQHQQEILSAEVTSSLANDITPDADEPTAIAEFESPSPDQRLAQFDKDTPELGSNDIAVTFDEDPTESPSSVESETAVSQHQQEILSAEVTSSLANDITPDADEPTAIAEFESPSPDQRLAQFDKDTPELGSNDIAVTFDEVPTESPSSVESETAVSQHQQEILSAEVTSSLANDITPDADEPTAIAKFESPSPDQPLAQFDKDTPELGSNDIAVTFHEDSAESPSSVESETAVSQHQQEILSAEVTPSLANDITPDADEPTAIAKFESPSPDQPLAQFDKDTPELDQPLAQLNKDTPELGSNDIAVTFDEDLLVESRDRRLPASTRDPFCRSDTLHWQNDITQQQQMSQQPSLNSNPYHQISHWLTFDKDTQNLVPMTSQVTFDEDSAESPSSVESETRRLPASTKILSAEVTPSLGNDITPDADEPTAIAEFDPYHQISHWLNLTRIHQNLVPMTSKSPSSVESETAVSQHQQEILSAEVTPSLGNDITPDADEPTAIAEFESLSPDQPLAQFDKDTPELGSNDIAVTFDEDPTESPSSVESETAVSQHQQEILSAEVTPSLANDITPDADEPTAIAEFESLSPDQPLAQYDKDAPELGSNDIAVTFDEDPTESPSSVESETAVSQHQQEILSAEVTPSLANDITPDADEPTAIAEFESLSADQPLAQFDKDTPELGSNDIAVTFDEDPTESPSSVESETAVSQHQQENLSAEVTSSLANNITPDADEPTTIAEFESLSPDQPLAQFDKDTPELGSNDIAVTFDEDPTESPSSVESETAVPQHQQEILSAEVTSSLANDITPEADEPTATAEFESPSPDQPLAQYDKDTPELGSNDIAVTFDEDPTESPSSVESETAVSQHQQEILSAEVTSSLANDITPEADEPTATAEFESPSPDQPLAKFDKDTPELGSNDIAVTFDEDPTESPSSVESETAVSQHQQENLSAEVTSSLANNITPDADEPTTIAEFESPSPDQPLAQFDKDTPELGSNDIAVTFHEDSAESPSSVESETAVSQHQQEILSAEVTSSLANDITPDADEPTATAEFESPSPDQPLAQYDKDTPELGSNDIAVTFDEDPTESPSSVESETAVSQHQQEILSAEVTSSLANDITPEADEPTATAEFESPSPDQPLAKFDKDTPELGSNDIAVTFDEDPTESPSSVESETAISQHQQEILSAEVTSSLANDITPDADEPTAIAEFESPSPDQPLAKFDKDTPELGSNDIAVTFDENSAESPSSVESETAVSQHQQEILSAEVTPSLANDITPDADEPTAIAEFESLSPDQPLAQFDKDTPELGSNDIAVTFDEDPTESPSSVESETAVSQHQQEILSAEVTSSLANDITPDADEPTATAEFESPSPDQPLAQYDKDTPELGSNDIAVTFDEDPTGMFNYKLSGNSLLL
ncbi:uncharacterized protein LOC135690951 [Rhopilema esculentum]|uniref:uncharacterized protein LOC135690951 n=1 Tax=Rhopilema esculentum TaxID=499914 RepID=UPI0031D978E0